MHAHSSALLAGSGLNQGLDFRSAFGIHRIAESLVGEEPRAICKTEPIRFERSECVPDA
jgi:hypothetical protein